MLAYAKKGVHVRAALLMQVLLDPVARKAYDQALSYGLPTDSSAAQQPQPATSTDPGAAPGPPGPTLEQLDDDDLWAAAAQQTAQSCSAAQPPPPAPAHVDVQELKAESQYDSARSTLASRLLEIATQVRALALCLFLYLCHMRISSCGMGLH